MLRCLCLNLAARESTKGFRVYGKRKKGGNTGVKTKQARAVDSTHPARKSENTIRKSRPTYCFLARKARLHLLRVRDCFVFLSFVFVFNSALVACRLRPPRWDFFQVCCVFAVAKNMLRSEPTFFFSGCSWKEMVVFAFFVNAPISRDASRCFQNWRA